jgi:hypothetical protein
MNLIASSLNVISTFRRVFVRANSMLSDKQNWQKTGKFAISLTAGDDRGSGKYFSFKPTSKIPAAYQLLSFRVYDDEEHPRHRGYEP